MSYVRSGGLGGQRRKLEWRKGNFHVDFVSPPRLALFSPHLSFSPGPPFSHSPRAPLTGFSPPVGAPPQGGFLGFRHPRSAPPPPQAWARPGPPRSRWDGAGSGGRAASTKSSRSRRAAAPGGPDLAEPPPRSPTAPPAPAPGGAPRPGPSAPPGPGGAPGSATARGPRAAPGGAPAAPAAPRSVPPHFTGRVPAAEGSPGAGKGSRALLTGPEGARGVPGGAGEGGGLASTPRPRDGGGGAAIGAAPRPRRGKVGGVKEGPATPGPALGARRGGAPGGPGAGGARGLCGETGEGRGRRQRGPGRRGWRGGSDWGGIAAPRESPGGPGTGQPGRGAAEGDPALNSFRRCRRVGAGRGGGGGRRGRR